MNFKFLAASFAAVFSITAFNAGLANANQVDDIKANGEIIIGTLGTDEPSSFIDPKTRQLIGYEIDLGNAIAEKLGVKAKFKQISVAARIPELQQKRVDILAASLTHTKDRESQVDFTYTTLVTGQVALVKKDAGVDHIKDLAGKKVLTVRGGTQEPNINKAVPDAKVVTFETSQQAFQALRQGKGVAFVDDESALLDYYGKLGPQKDDYKVLDESISVEPLAIAVRKGETELKDLINNTLAELEDSGAAEKIFFKWYGPGTNANLEQRNFKINSDVIQE